MGSPEPRRRFEAIYAAHYPAILSYVRRRTDSPDDAADAIAESAGLEVTGKAFTMSPGGPTHRGFNAVVTTQRVAT